MRRYRYFAGVFPPEFCVRLTYSIVAELAQNRRRRAQRANAMVDEGDVVQRPAAATTPALDDDRIGDISMAEGTTPAGVFANGARLAADAMLPGVSQVVNGDIKSGTAHAATAIGAATLVGGGLLVPLIWTAVGLNSYSRSVTGRNLFEHFDWRKAVE
jgi:hypothetical protein